MNVVDTGPWEDGKAEERVGHVLDGMVQQGKLRRESVIVMSKCGMMNEEMRGFAESQEQAGRPLDALVKAGKTSWYCYDPRFIELQLNRSLRRLGLNCIDVYTLHSLERLLLDRPYEQFEREIVQSFQFLQEQVELGKIASFGVTVQRTSPELQRLIAKCSAMFSSLQFVQFPLNLYEHDAVQRGSEHESFAELSKRRGLTTVSLRTINASLDGLLVKLRDMPRADGDVDFDSLKHLVAVAMRYEQDFKKYWESSDSEIVSQLPHPQSMAATELLFQTPLNPWMWMGLRDGALAQAVNYAGSLHANRKIGRWSMNYFKALKDLVHGFDSFFGIQGYTHIEELNAALNQCSPSTQGYPLAERAVSLSLAHEHVDLVAIGARSGQIYESYLSGALPNPPSSEARNVFASDFKQLTPLLSQSNERFV